MSKHKLIPYPVIAAAVRGDPEAVNRVLDHYSGYIAALSIKNSMISHRPSSAASFCPPACPLRSG